MSDFVKIPMFPLSIFPLPGELVPLHIFEPRYRQLLIDAETKDTRFGIYCNHTANRQKVGSLVKLESVIKHYVSGESDIIVKCYDLFTMNTFYPTYRDKLYPGGDVKISNLDMSKSAGEKLFVKYQDYAAQLKIIQQEKNPSVYHIANELNMDLEGKIKFVESDEDKKETFLSNQISYLLQILKQADKSKDVFHLN